MTVPVPLVRLATAGSVDDGKSTLIGRLLFETGSLKEDKLDYIHKVSRQRGMTYLDYSLATDGLVSEVEQGITIDVAHLYMNGVNRRYIIADTPGHIEYTRNMVTGASTADVMLILIDARHGITEQTRRHLYIGALLRVGKIICLVNKMDLVNYDQHVFAELADRFSELAEDIQYPKHRLEIVPISALQGEGLTGVSPRMPWYSGKALLPLLEGLSPDKLNNNGIPHFRVQQVIRSHDGVLGEYRAVAGKLYGGNLRLFETVTVLPSGRQTRIKGIRLGEDVYDLASPGSSISLEMEDEIDIQRGDIIVPAACELATDVRLEALITQLVSDPLIPGKRYILQQGTRQVPAMIETLDNKLASDFSSTVPTDRLALNDIGKVTVKLGQALAYRPFSQNRELGSFILIHPQTGDTCAVGFIQESSTNP